MHKWRKQKPKKVLVLTAKKKQRKLMTHAAERFVANYPQCNAQRSDLSAVKYIVGVDGNVKGVKGVNSLPTAHETAAIVAYCHQWWRHSACWQLVNIFITAANIL